MDGVLSHLYNNLFTCKICDEKFSSKHLLNEHEKSHSEEEIQQSGDEEPIPGKMNSVFRLLYNNLFTCKTCGKRFSSQVHLVQHELVHTGGGRVQPNDRSEGEVDMKDQKGMGGVMSMLYNNLFECKLCSVKFSLQSQLTEHEKIHTGGVEVKVEVQMPDDGAKGAVLGVQSGTDGMMNMSYNNFVHCSFCYLQFPSKEILKEHEALHTRESFGPSPAQTEPSPNEEDMDGAMSLLYNNLFPCKMCNVKFSRKNHLTQHEELHANGTLPIEQPNITVKTEPVDTEYDGDMGNHKKVYSKEKYYMETDAAAEARKDKVYQEMDAAVEARHKDRMEGMFKMLYNNLFTCKICNERFASKDLLKKHEIIHLSGGNMHQGNETELEGKNKETESPSEHVDVTLDEETQKKIDDHIHERMDGVLRLLYNNLHQCKICHEKFSSRPQLTQHEMTHAGTSRTKDGTDPKLTVDGAVKPKKVLEKNYKCDICGHAFTQKYKLIRHYRVHTGERPYKCDLCGAAFSQKSVLVNHERLHTGEKPYSCELCGATFSVKGYLIKHHRTHTGEKPFKCDKCDSVFGDRGNLSKHKKIHTGEKPYRCGTCTAAFSDRSTLMKHQRIHTDEKQYKCEHCNASFNMKSALTTHKKVHLSDEQHKCDVCDAEFSARGYLIRHLRTHTGEKQYIPSFLMPQASDYSLMPTATSTGESMDYDESLDQSPVEEQNDEPGSQDGYSPASLKLTATNTGENMDVDKSQGKFSVEEHNNVPVSQKQKKDDPIEEKDGDTQMNANTSLGQVGSIKKEAEEDLSREKNPEIENV